jgi:hypothetical protein
MNKQPPTTQELQRQMHIQRERDFGRLTLPGDAHGAMRPYSTEELVHHQQETVKAAEQQAARLALWHIPLAEVISITAAPSYQPTQQPPQAPEQTQTRQLEW